jgi:rRNA small subunit pseudouridine methyltransferase Nep1
VLNLVIAEAALELIPDQIIRHPSVSNDARRTGNEPSTIILDRSIHHAAMAKLSDQFKRGRPDLVHLTLLNATSTPLYQDGLAKVYIHTRNDLVLEFKEQTRPPKSYSRFRDLMRKSLREMPESGLIEVRELTLDGLLKRIGPDLSVGLSVQGSFSGYEELAAELSGKRNPVALVGGFPRGHFTPETTGSMDRLVRVDRRSLDAHVVVARVLYEVEKRVLATGRATDG